MKEMFMIGCVTLALAVMLMTGCEEPEKYWNPEADPVAVSRVAVIPFDNNSREQDAHKRVTNVFTTVLQAQNPFGWEVVEPGFVTKELAAMNVNDGKMTQVQLQEFGEKLNVQAVIFGAVEQYVTERVGQESFPTVAITVRVVDVGSGRPICTITHNANGASKVPLIAVGETHTLSEMTIKVCRMIVDELRP